MGIFDGDQCITVITKGPGTLTLLTYAGGNLSSTIGAKTTNNSGQTRWMIGFSHNYTRFAFIWQGNGEAVYRIGSSLQTAPVGRAWTAASLVAWGSHTITESDVSSNVSSALNRDNRTTFWIIPDSI